MYILKHVLNEESIIKLNELHNILIFKYKSETIFKYLNIYNIF